MNLEHIDVFFRVHRGSDAPRLSSRLTFNSKGVLALHFIGVSFLHLVLQHLLQEQGQRSGYFKKSEKVLVT